MELKTRYMAAKLFLDFIRDFSRLNEEQLSEVRKLMQETVSGVMNEMLNLAQAPSQRSLPNSEAGSPTDKVQSPAHPYSKSIEELASMNNRVGQMLSSLMGTVSTEDVIYQRINHIVQSFQTFNTTMRQFVADFEGSMSPENVTQAKNVMLTQIYRTYTTEEERSIFHRIFGKPKKAKKAA